MRSFYHYVRGLTEVETLKGKTRAQTLTRQYSRDRLSMSMTQITNMFKNMSIPRLLKLMHK